MHVNITHLKNILSDVKNEVVTVNRQNSTEYRFSLKGVSKLVGISKDYYSKVIRSKVTDSQSQYPLMRHLMSKKYKRRQINKWAQEGTPIEALEHIVEYYARIAPINNQKALAQVVLQEGNACRLLGKFMGIPLSKKKSKNQHPEVQEDLLRLVSQYQDIKKRQERLMANYRDLLESSEEVYSQIKALGYDPDEFMNAVEILKQYGSDFDFQHEPGNERVRIEIAGQPNS